MAGTCVPGESHLVEADLGHALPGIVDVARGAPEIAAHVGAPLPHIVPAVLAKAVDDGAAGLEQCLMHFLVGLVHDLHLLCLIVGRLLAHDLAKTAEVILQVVDAPLRIGLGVLLFMPIAARVLSAGFGPGTGVDADLQSFGVDVVGQRLHVGKFVVGLDESIGVALALPGVVDVDVDVAGIAHAGGHHARQRRRARPHHSRVPAKWFQLFHPMGGVAATVESWATRSPPQATRARAMNTVTKRLRIDTGRFPFRSVTSRSRNRWTVYCNSKQPSAPDGVDP